MSAASTLSSSAIGARAAVAPTSRGLRARRMSSSRVVRARSAFASATPADKSHVVVFGGTGGTGSECVVQALKRGAKVTVLARTPSKLTQPPGTGGSAEGQPIVDPNLTVVQGDVTNAADVAKVITSDITGVVVSLGGKTKDVGKTMLTDGTLNVINAMKSADVKRVAIVTSIGAGDSADQAPLMFRVLMSTVMRSIFTDKNNQEQLFLGPAGPGRDLEFCRRPPRRARHRTSHRRRQRHRRRSRLHRARRRRGLLPRRALRGSVPVHRKGAVHQQRGRDVLDQGPRREGRDGGVRRNEKEGGEGGSQKVGSPKVGPPKVGSEGALILSADHRGE